MFDSQLKTLVSLGRLEQRKSRFRQLTYIRRPGQNWKLKEQTFSRVFAQLLIICLPPCSFPLCFKSPPFSATFYFRAIGPCKSSFWVRDHYCSDSRRYEPILSKISPQLQNARNTHRKKKLILLFFIKLKEYTDYTFIYFSSFSVKIHKN